MEKKNTAHVLWYAGCQLTIFQTPTAQLHNFMRLNFRLIDIPFHNSKGLETKEVLYSTSESICQSLNANKTISNAVTSPLVKTRVRIL